MQGKASFCEQKEAKKLYLLWAMGVIGDTDSGPAEPRVFAPLFSKSGHFLSRKPIGARVI
jgi:hypothetical protein